MGLTNSVDQQQDQSYADLLARAQGTQFVTYAPTLITNPSAPVTQTVFGTSLYATAGSLITGIKMRNSTAAAGTAPTLARFGLTDATGKVLALSANLAAAANWPAGAMTFPFTGALTLPASGIYFPSFVVNGTWGTTQPTPGRTGNIGNMFAADGANPPPSYQLSAQTDLPAVGASVVLGAPALVYWFGLY